MVRSSWFAGDEAGSGASAAVRVLAKPFHRCGDVEGLESLANAALVARPGRQEADCPPWASVIWAWELGVES